MTPHTPGVAGGVAGARRGLDVMEQYPDCWRGLLKLGDGSVVLPHPARSLWKSEAIEDHGLIFCNELGRPKNASALVGRGFLPLLWRAGLPGVRLHDLRHTRATPLLKRGVHSKVVQNLLGYSSISITLDTYSHVLEGMGEVAPRAMDEEFGPAHDARGGASMVIPNIVPDDDRDAAAGKPGTTG